jgi:Na+/H+-dicarboxylate symporter
MDLAALYYSGYHERSQSIQNALADDAGRNYGVRYVFVRGDDSCYAQRSKKIAHKENTVSFVIPLCANLHIPSVTIHFVLCAIAVMMMVGQPLELESFFIFIMMLTFTCVAVPGVPGGVVAVLPVLSTVLGFSAEMQAVCLSLGILLDAPLTAANVLCDGAICAIGDKATD